ncbi:MAG: mandelate racemase, partial [Acidimicrobiia bacterium]|nr:mandelate racemase [Acidimicrobiia bacterium]
WAATTLVLVEVTAGGRTGLGYTYGAHAVADLVEDLLADVVCGGDAMAVGAAWQAMVDAVRNAGRPGLGSMAIAAVDTALWDLKARLLDLPLVSLLGAVRPGVEVYGSGGFTSFTPTELDEQLRGWAAAGLRSVKMKVGRDPTADADRVAAAREAVGAGGALFVDANGAYTAKQALALAERFAADADVTWFEEPVSSDDLAGLRLVRDRAPAGMEVAAGEYGHDLSYFRRMIAAGAVDVLQADATRCGGITGFLGVDALCEADGLELSAHCAPALHLHPCCSARRLRHVEWFADHVRVEALLFDGAPGVTDGVIAPDLDRPGLGLDLKRADAAPYLRASR